MRKIPRLLISSVLLLNSAFLGAQPKIDLSRQTRGTLPNSRVSAKAYVDVREYAGSDWCAQSSAADAAFIGVSATLSVPSAMSGMAACRTAINLTAGHALQFGAGIFDMGIADARAGIRIAHSINNVDIGGAGRAVTTLFYTSHNNGISNGFPNGSAIGVGTVTQCLAPADANNKIRIHDIRFVDRNTGSAMASGHNPSAVDGACVNDIVIESNEFNNIKGQGLTVLGNFGGGGGTLYRDQNNLFTGDAAGGWGEFSPENSANWATYFVIGNSFSGYKCGMGGAARIYRGIISHNFIDQTLVANTCTAVNLGAGGEGPAGYIEASDNVVFMGVGAAFQMNLQNNANNRQMAVLNNTVVSSTGSSACVWVNGTAFGAPDQIIRNNYCNTSYGIVAQSYPIGNLEISGNTIDGTGIGGNAEIFGCASGLFTIQSGSVVRVFNNRIHNYTSNSVNRSCTNASFQSRQYQEWDNTLGNGSPDNYYGGYLGSPAQVSWTPGTIPANSSTPNQLATINQTIPGDTVKIVSANGGSNWIGLPPGVFAYGSVTSANTVTFNIMNTTSFPVTIAGGLQIQSYVQVDRPPN